MCLSLRGDLDGEGGKIFTSGDECEAGYFSGACRGGGANQFLGELHIALTMALLQISMGDLGWI